MKNAHQPLKNGGGTVEVCPVCSGSGRHPGGPCPLCFGSGYPTDTSEHYAFIEGNKKRGEAK